MKSNGIRFLILTSILLITISILVYFNFNFSIIFYLTLIGQILLIFTVYKVLTDIYKTEKTFDDWYEDYPIDEK